MRAYDSVCISMFERDIPKAVRRPLPSQLEGSWIRGWFAITKRCIPKTSAVALAYANRPLATSMDR